MSLKKYINKEIENKFPRVYKSENDKISKIYNWIFKKNFGEILLIYSAFIIVIILYSQFIDIKFLKILDIKFDDTVKTFTTGIITLVSMNLFVTNLLLTHLRDERDDLQSIIDRRINFKFITYLGFTNIICVLFLYFFSPSIYNESIKSNILIFLFSSFVGYIFLLVFLYNNVFNFIHKTKRTEIVKKELNLEFYKAFYNDYFKRRFKEEYKNLLEVKLNFQSYPIWQEIEEINHYTYNPSKNVYLKDINIKAISALAKQINSSKKYYHIIDLGKEYQKDIEIKLFSLPLNRNLKFKKIYSFSSKVSFKTEYSQEYLDTLLKKVRDNTLRNKYNELSTNLKSLENIYSEYIELENEI